MAVVNGWPGAVAPIGVYKEADVREILTLNAPAPAGHYSQAVVHGGVVYVAGQLPVDPQTGRGLLAGSKARLNRH